MKINKLESGNFIYIGKEKFIVKKISNGNKKKIIELFPINEKINSAKIEIAKNDIIFFKEETVECKINKNSLKFEDRIFQIISTTPSFRKNDELKKIEKINLLELKQIGKDSIKEFLRLELSPSGNTGIFYDKQKISESQIKRNPPKEKERLKELKVKIKYKDKV